MRTTQKVIYSGGNSQGQPGTGRRGVERHAYGERTPAKRKDSLCLGAGEAKPVAANGNCPVVFGWPFANVCLGCTTTASKSQQNPKEQNFSLISHRFVAHNTRGQARPRLSRSKWNGNGTAPLPEVRSLGRGGIRLRLLTELVSSRQAIMQSRTLQGQAQRARQCLASNGP